MNTPRLIVATTIIGASAFGSTCARMIRHGVAPEGPRGLHVVVGLDLQDARPHQPGEARPAEDRQHQHDLAHHQQVGRVDVVGERRHEQDAAEQQRDREEDVRDPRDQRVEPAAVVAGDDADGATDEHGRDRGEHAHQDRGPGTVDGARVDVVALDVAAEPRRCRWASRGPPSAPRRSGSTLVNSDGHDGHQHEATMSTAETQKIGFFLSDRQASDGANAPRPGPGRGAGLGADGNGRCLSHG